MVKLLLASTALPLLMLVSAAASAAPRPPMMLAQAGVPEAASEVEDREDRPREERPSERRARERDAGAQAPQDAGQPPRRERAADQPDRPGRQERPERPARERDDPARAVPTDPPAASEAAPASPPPEPPAEPPRAAPEAPAAPETPPVAEPAAPEEPPAVQPPPAPAPAVEAERPEAEPAAPAADAPPAAPPEEAPAAQPGTEPPASTAAPEPARPAAEPRRRGPPDRQPDQRGFRGFADPKSPEFERFAPGARRGPDRGAGIDDLRRSRRERVEDGGRRVIIEEPDRVIIREGGRSIVRHDETDRFRRSYRDAEVRVERRGAEEITIVRRPNGIEIVTVRDPEGRLLRRIRRHAGVETVLIDNILRDRPRRGGLIIHEVVVPPPQVQIAREHYVVELRSASPAQIYEVFTAPPVAQVARAYTLDEVRQSRNLREYVRRVDVDTVTFDFGSWQLGEDQIPLLAGVAEAMRRALEHNPDEIFLIEGHTDAVGSEIDNLTLSDRRAETVAMILTDHFDIPAENLTTQGYGEQFLKIDTQAAERRNRRVELRRITPLLRGQAGR
jgi:outer membrane protein OmpA-like peptidoglycan-associated protein